MAHKTLIGGTAYEISGGKTLINGTAYEIKGGKTLVGGTAYDVGFLVTVDVIGFGGLNALSDKPGFAFISVDSEEYSGSIISPNTAKTYSLPYGTVITCWIGAKYEAVGTVTLNGVVVKQVTNSTDTFIDGGRYESYDYIVTKSTTITIGYTTVDSKQFGTITIEEH